LPVLLDVLIHNIHEGSDACVVGQGEVTAHGACLREVHIAADEKHHRGGVRQEVLVAVGAVVGEVVGAGLAACGQLVALEVHELVGLIDDPAVEPEAVCLAVNGNLCVGVDERCAGYRLMRGGYGAAETAADGGGPCFRAGAAGGFFHGRRSPLLQRYSFQGFPAGAA